MWEPVLETKGSVCSKKEVVKLQYCNSNIGEDNNFIILNITIQAILLGEWKETNNMSTFV